MLVDWYRLSDIFIVTYILGYKCKAFTEGEKAVHTPQSSSVNSRESKHCILGSIWGKGRPTKQDKGQKLYIVDAQIDIGKTLVCKDKLRRVMLYVYFSQDGLGCVLWFDVLQ